MLLLVTTVVLGFGEPSPGRAQTPARTDTVSETIVAPAVLDSAALARASWVYQMDYQILLGVYQQKAWILEEIMIGAHYSAYPVFWGSIPAAWTAALATGRDYPAAYRFTLSHLLAGETTSLLKNVFGRFRPFIIVARVKSRSPWMTRKEVLTEKRYSFPSGHATTSFAIATSLSLSYPRWYVIAPSLIWATAVSVSRMWLGVHYPSDVMAGALVGATVATGVHLLRSYITPFFLKNDETTDAPMLRLRIPLP